ncbi:MAG: RdgB/HAM1 family non-canonical purine NTP pyrophosphatase [Pseudomonadota bacterium]
MIETLILATHNQGKVDEFGVMLGDVLGTKIKEIKSAAAFNLPEPEETEDSFVGNALLKARAACSKTGLPSLADDSGLAVDALNGAPGIYSARWAETEKGRDFKKAMQRVNEECGRINGTQTARFVAVLALVYPSGEEVTFEGTVEGHLVWPPQGEKGFGYDPIFEPKGHDITFAEMEQNKKNAMSHRANAVKKFIEYLNTHA